MRLAMLAFAVVLLGCTDGEHALVVDLRTDYLPEIEAARARVAVLEGVAVVAEADVALGRDDDLLAGHRLAELGPFAAGTVPLRVELLRPDGGVLATRRVQVSLSNDTVVTAVITRSCEGVECPAPAGSPELAACLNGSCVDEACTPETPEACETPALCEADADCPEPDAACARARCVEGACLDGPGGGLCRVDQYCDPVRGCTYYPSEDDAGVDAGAIDAGGGCAPLTADCNGEASDGCEADLTRHETCGGCAACAPFESCQATRCESRADFESLSRVAGATSDTRLFAMTMNASGVHAAVGKFDGMADLGDGAPVPATMDDGFATVFDGTGSNVFARALGGAAIEGGNGVDVDASGSVYVIGEFRGNPDFGLGPLANQGDTDPFFLRFDAGGAPLWSTAGGSTAGEMGHAIAAMPDGGAIGVGGVAGTSAAFGVFSNPVSGGRDLFVARIDAAGGFAWARVDGSTANDEARGVAVTGDRVHVVGYYSGTTDFGGPMRLASGGRDIFLQTLDHAGAYVGDVVGGGPNDDAAYAVAADDTGHRYVVGEHRGGVTFGGADLGPGTDGDAFVACVGPDGATVWATRGEGALSQVAHGVTVASGRVYAAGWFEGTMQLGQRTLVSPAGRSGWVARFDPVDGSVLWARVLSGVTALDVGIDGAGLVAVAGYFSGTADFGGGPVTAIGPSDGFIVRYREP